MGSSGMSPTDAVAAALAASTQMAAGLAQVPVMLAGAVAQVTVEIKPAMPAGAPYTATAFVTSQAVGGLNLLSKLEVQAVTPVDEAHVRVDVKNTGLLQLAGAYVNVVAVRA